jgi:serine O-acetyltransferase
MFGAVISHLDHVLRQCFVTYPKGLATDVARFVLAVREMLTYDLNFGYVKDRSFTWDEDRLIGLLQFSTAAETVFYYRLAHAIFREDPQHSALPYLASLMRLRTGAEIYYSTEIGPGFNVQHGAGIVVGPRNKIGSHFIIHQGATVGQGNLYASGDATVIGDHVTLYAGAKVVGHVTVGDYVWLGANAVLTKNAEGHSIYAGAPARKLRSFSPVEYELVASRVK